jgi:5-methylthioribose kinase
MAPKGFSPDSKNPNYPCDSDRPKAVGEYLIARNFLDRGERVERLTPASPQGRNATWRVETNARAFVVKQFRPWPANGRAAPTADERFRAECQFYRTARIADGLGRSLPSLLHHDNRAGCVILEDVAARDSADLQLTSADATALAWFLVALHHHSQSVPDSARYGSREIVGWQMAHLFQQSPRASRQAAGRWLARFTALGEKARHAIEDAQARLAHEGSSLVHGDFTAANWVRARDGSLRVVDAEFSFFGPPEFDAGALLASLVHLRVPNEVLRAGVDVITRGCMRYHGRLTAAYAVVHLCDRLENPPATGERLRGAAASGALRRLARVVETGSLEAIIAERA